MSLTDLFKKINAPLKNSRWSWGSTRPDGSVVLRVWQDRKEKINGKWHIMVAHHEKYRNNENKSFNGEDIFVGGNIIEHNDDTYIELVGRHSINKIT